jgi:hypothetical protein
MQQQKYDGPPWETAAAAPATAFRPVLSAGVAGAVPEAAETAAVVATWLSYPWLRAQPA